MSKSIAVKEVPVEIAGAPRKYTATAECPFCKKAYTSNHKYHLGYGVLVTGSDKCEHAIGLFPGGNGEQMARFEIYQ